MDYIARIAVVSYELEYKKNEQAKQHDKYHCEVWDFKLEDWKIQLKVEMVISEFVNEGNFRHRHSHDTCQRSGPSDYSLQEVKHLFNQL